MITSLRHSTSQRLLHRKRSIEELTEWPFFHGMRITLDISEVCNQQCAFCDNRIALLKSGRTPHRWNLEQFNIVLPKLAKYNTIVFAGTAGEPLLNNDLPAMLQQIKQLRGNHRTEIFTNGVTLTPAMTERILPWIDSFRISMCATTPETHSQLVRNSDFSRITQNLICLDAMKPKRVSWHINFIGMKCNIHELSDAVKLASRLGAEGVYLQTLVEKGEPFVQGQCLVRQPELLQMYWKKAEEVAQQVGVSLAVGGAYKTVIENQSAEPEVLFDEDGEPLDWVLGQSRETPGTGETRDCAMPFDNTILDHNGDVAPCCSRTWERTDSPNVFNGIEGSLASQFLSIRKGLLTGELPKACAQCRRAPIIGIEEFVERMTEEYNLRWLKENFITRYILSRSNSSKTQ